MPYGVTSSSTGARQACPSATAHRESATSPALSISATPVDPNDPPPLYNKTCHIAGSFGVGFKAGFDSAAKRSFYGTGVNREVTSASAGPVG